MIPSIDRSDPVLWAGAIALGAGALGIVVPFYRGLAEASAALAALAWLPRSLASAPDGRTAGASPRTVGGFGTMAAAATAFLWAPPPFDRLGALALGGGAVGLAFWIPARSAPEGR